jgi:hypothetical protein
MFDVTKLTVMPITEGDRKVTAEDIIKPEKLKKLKPNKDVDKLADRLAEIRNGPGRRVTSKGRRVMLFMGAHPIKCGMTRLLVNLMKHGWITSIATTGAALIHDFELSWYGCTSEDVTTNIKTGQFGHWESMVELSALLNMFWGSGLGLGETAGKCLSDRNGFARHANPDHSLFAQAYRLGVPVTVHPTIGADIAVQAPNFVGEVWGALAYRDFLIFAEQVSQLQRGAYISLGSSVTSPEVFLKALSMSRNVQDGLPDSFTTAVFDINEQQGRTWLNTPERLNDYQPDYYWRPGKTILHRTNPDGEKIFVGGDMRETIPNLYRRLING